MQKKYKIESIERLQSQKNLIRKVIINSRVAEKLIKIYEI